VMIAPHGKGGASTLGGVKNPAVPGAAIRHYSVQASCENCAGDEGCTANHKIVIKYFQPKKQTIAQDLFSPGRLSQYYPVDTTKCEVPF
jgi:hypothetical protein